MAAGVALLLLSIAQGQGRASSAAVVHPPQSHYLFNPDALTPVRHALNALRRGPGKVRLLFYGASHTASDEYTGFLRDALAQRFGDGGPGFVLPMQAFPFHDHQRVGWGEGRGVRVERLDPRRPRRGNYGLAGVSVVAGPSATLTLESSTPFDEVELFVSGQAGARLSITADAVRIPLAMPARGARIPVELDGPARRISVRVREAPSRIYGLSLERRTGVVVDALGIPGARARDMLLWEEGSQRELLGHRRPDLWVLAYGTNESSNRRVPLPTYQWHLQTVIDRMKRATPHSSCMLIGPSSWPMQRPNGSFRPRARVTEIAQIQRRVSERNGCAFFDLQAFQGGPLGMVRWVHARPALGLRDFVHFTEHGHRALSEALERALDPGDESTSTSGSPQPN